MDAADLVNSDYLDDDMHHNICTRRSIQLYHCVWMYLMIWKSVDDIDVDIVIIIDVSA